MAKAANSAGGLAAAARRLGLQPTYRARGSWKDLDALGEELREVARAIREEEEEEAAKRRGNGGIGVGGGIAGIKKAKLKVERGDRQQRQLAMPTQAQLRAMAGKSALIHAIRRHGGARVVAERAGLAFGEKRGRRKAKGEEGGGEREGEGDEEGEAAAAALRRLIGTVKSRKGE